MTTSTECIPISRPGVPLWLQIVVWAFLTGLLVLMGMGLRRAERGTVRPGDKLPDFSLTLFSGYEYSGQSEVKVSDLLGTAVLNNFWVSWCKPCELE